MTERKQRWLARTFWVTLFSAVPVCLGIWLSTLKVHNTLAVLLYTVVGGMVVIVVVTAAIVVVLTLFGWTELDDPRAITGGMQHGMRHEGLIPKLWRIAWKS